MHLRWSEDHAIAAADFSLRRFRECAIPVPAGSRLPVARACIRSNRGRGIIQPTLQVALSEQILEAHRSVMEFYLVACALEGRTDSLATVVPRELLTAALLRLAGIRGVTLAEPDIRIAAGSTYLGIAAKRIRSLAERKREHHLRKAIDQLRLQGLPGYVFLNLDSVMSDVFQQEGHAAATSLLPDVTQVAQDYIAAIQARDLTRGVYGFAHGVFAFATLLGWDASVSPARLTLHVSCHAAVGVPTEEQEGFLRFLAGRGDHLTHTLRALIQQLEMAAALC
jgi:hypothetical protein